MTPEQQAIEKKPTASAFMDAMVARFVERVPDMDHNEACSQALECLRNAEESDGPFGTEGYDWNASAAHELVDEELSYWAEY